MLKTWFALLNLGLLFIAQLAYPMPELGDSATFSVTTTQNNQVTESTEQWTLTSSNSSTQQYQIQTTLTPTGSSAQVQSAWKPMSNLNTSTAIAQTLAHCQQLKGTLQTITVPAGTFQTCALPGNAGNQTGTLWLGNVPFGVVKMQVIQSGQQITRELSSFTFGQ